MENLWWDKRSQLSQQAQKQRTRSPWFAPSIFLMIIALMVSALVFSPSTTAPYQSTFGSTVYPASTIAIVAGCGDTFTFPNIDSRNFGEFPPGFFGTEANPKSRSIPYAPNIVPTWGYFRGNIDISPNFYTLRSPKIPTREELLNLEYQGKIILWYQPTITPEAVEILRKFAEKEPDYYVVPWEQKSALPLGRSYATASWGISQSCEAISGDVLQQFKSFVVENRIPRPEKPPIAPLDSRGELYPMDSEP